MSTTTIAEPSPAARAAVQAAVAALRTRPPQQPCSHCRQTKWQRLSAGDWRCSVCFRPGPVTLPTEAEEQAAAVQAFKDFEAKEYEETTARLRRQIALDRRRDRRRPGAVYATMQATLLHRWAPTRYAPPRSREWEGVPLVDFARKDAELRSDVETFDLPPRLLAARALRCGSYDWVRSAQSYHTTSDFGSLLTGTITTLLRDTFVDAPRTYEAWTRPVVVSSFKQTIVAAAHFPQLRLVDEQGEISRGTPPMTTAALRLREFARIVALSHEALLNDDVGLIGGMIESLAGAAAACESDVAYAALLDNPTTADGFPLFSSQHGNVAAAAGITTASLTAATLLLGAQRAPTGEALNLLPSFVLCGPALAADARTVLAAQTPPSGAETAAVPQLVVDARIRDARWYLACDPGAWPTVVVAHLTDQPTPLVDTRNGWDIEGREVRARLDVAAVAADYRGLVLTPAA
jgi:ribosomal protein L37AE/L43A